MTDRDLLQRAEDALGLAYAQIQHVEPFVVQVLAELRARLSTPPTPVQVPDAEGLARIVYEACPWQYSDTDEPMPWDDPIVRECGRQDECRAIALAVARACLAPIVEVLREMRDAHLECVQGMDHDDENCPCDDTCECANVAAVNAMFKRAQSVIDSLAGRT